MAARPLLNVDGGESEEEPVELYALADVVHVACGGHAGDDASMDRVTRACTREGTRVGAHPSYEDREGFGRRAREVAPDELTASIAAQCARLQAIASRAGVTLASVKAHGALYHAAHASEATARAFVAGVTRVSRRHARDRRPRRRRARERGARPPACRTSARPSPIAAYAPTEASSRAESRARSSSIRRIAAARTRELSARDDVDTLCIHGDTPGAVDIARAVRAALGPKVRV